jgi:pimeloyl-ACP methyl ester carboxylesterase
MGGPVALEAASRLRGRVVGVIGVDTFKSIGAPPLPAADVEARLRAFENDFMATTRAFVTQTFFPANADPALVRKIADDMVQAPPEVAIPSIRGLNAMDYSRVFATLDVPVIAINSDHGDRTDVQRIRRIAQRFDAVIVPGLGHFLMMEDPARFNPILLEQIERLAAD